MGQNYTDRELDIAFVVHETARAFQARLNDDSPSLPWHWEMPSQKRVVLNGVRRVMKGVTPQEHHEEWVRDKLVLGWRYGDDKDVEKKTHPNLVPWDQLPDHEKRKSYLFIRVVQAMTEKV